MRPISLDCAVSATSNLTTTCFPVAVAIRAYRSDDAAGAAAVGPVVGAFATVAVGAGLAGLAAVGVATGSTGRTGVAAGELAAAGVVPTGAVGLAVGATTLVVAGLTAEGVGVEGDAGLQPTASRATAAVIATLSMVAFRMALIRSKRPNPLAVSGWMPPVSPQSGNGCPSPKGMCVPYTLWSGAKLRASFFTPRCSKAIVTSSSPRVILEDTTTPFPKAGW